MATAVVLLCDSNFLVPTVGTAIEARLHIRTLQSAYSSTCLIARITTSRLCDMS